MGLDNIPKTYPCESIAVRNSDNQIDCKATQECGNCPYMNEYQSDPLLENTSPVHGMFGTDCWYRGKYGNYMLADLKKYNSDFDNDMPSDFYGNTEEGIDADTCIEMSDVMFQYMEAWSYAVNKMVKEGELPEQNRDSYIRDWIYAAWWLKFVGNTSDGSAVWY